MEDLEVVLQKYLKVLLEELKKCKSKKRYSELVSIFYVIDELIKNVDMDIKYSKEFDYELKKYNLGKYNYSYETMFYNNFDNMYKYNLELSNIFKKIEAKYLYVINYNDYVDISDTIEMVRSFFSNYDKDIYKYFNEQILNGGLLVLSDRVDSGCTTLSNYILPPYSIVNPGVCARDYSVIVHETIHNYIRNRLRYINFDQLNTMLVNNLEEVFPIFTEFCAIKYCEDHHFLKEIYKYKDALYASLYTYLERFNSNLLNINPNDYVDNERYAYGFLLAHNYYNMCDDNIEEVKNRVMKFSLESPLHDKMYMLNNYGLNQEEILNSHKYLNLNK